MDPLEIDVANLSEAIDTIRELILIERASSGDHDAFEGILRALPAPTGSGELLVIDKLEVVKRQLETAIRLFFESGDPVSIHTLACAAHGVVRGFNKAQGGRPMLTSEADFQRINAPGNFFKHAEDDPDHFLRYRPAVALIWIFDAARKYTEITRKPIDLFAVLKMWMVHVFPKAFPNAKTNPDLEECFRKNDRRGFLGVALKAKKQQKEASATR